MLGLNTSSYLAVSLGITQLCQQEKPGIRASFQQAVGTVTNLWQCLRSSRSHLGAGGDHPCPREKRPLSPCEEQLTLNLRVLRWGPSQPQCQGRKFSSSITFPTNWMTSAAQHWAAIQEKVRPFPLLLLPINFLVCSGMGLLPFKRGSCSACHRAGRGARAE